MQIDQGSYDAGLATNAQIVMAPDAHSQTILARRSTALETEFRAAPLASLSLQALDIKALHVALFEGLCPDMPQAVGVFRGQAGSPLEHAKRAVRTRGKAAGLRQIDPCLAPQQVAAEMVRFEVQYAAFWDHPCPDIRTASALTFQFFWIHPFLDGNGHLWRLILIALVRRCGVQMSDSWQVGTRPYGPDFSLALQRFQADPSLLEKELDAFCIAPPLER